jgi:hypothetical protein
MYLKNSITHITFYELNIDEFRGKFSQPEKTTTQSTHSYRGENNVLNNKRTEHIKHGPIHEDEDDDKSAYPRAHRR